MTAHHENTDQLAISKTNLNKLKHVAGGEFDVDALALSFLVVDVLFEVHVQELEYKVQLVHVHDHIDEVHDVRVAQFAQDRNLPQTEISF